MEPLGTITVYFPFIDEEAKDILETTMQAAHDYYDFVNSLIDLVLETECSDLIVYFAVHHAIQLLDVKSINKIGRKYSHLPIIMPNLFFTTAFQGYSEDLDNVRKAADEVLATQPDGWLVLEMRFMKFESETWQYPNVQHDSSNLETILKMIKKEPNFGFYEAIYYSNLAACAHIDGDSKERIQCNEKAIEITRKFDDKIRLAYNLREKANIVESQDRRLAKELLFEAGNLMNFLGSKEGYSQVYESVSYLEAIRGEFNSAIEHYLEVVSIRESLGLETGWISLMLSTLYNIIAEFESGLEWGRMAEEQYMHAPKQQPRAVLNQVWSLIALRKISEATAILNTIRESIVKSGQETLLAWLNFITGLLELEDGDLTSAISSIEEALKIYEAREDLLMQILFLHNLAKIEVYKSNVTSEVFPYLTLLEERAISEDLPGILGQTLLLKSEIALLQNDDPRLREIIQQLRPLSQEPKMAFILPSFEKLLNRI
ncbi:MAG: hypothetical protein ACFFCX_09995 [Candidatus Sifarchaeia archaeon]